MTRGVLTSETPRLGSQAMAFPCVPRLLNTSIRLDEHSRFNWTNEHGGPLVHRGDPLPLLVGRYAASPRKSKQLPIGKPTPGVTYALAGGFLSGGDELLAMKVSTLQPALDACSAEPICRGVTHNGTGPNGTLAGPTVVHLKKGTAHLVPDRETGGHWFSWLKQAPVTAPVQTIKAGGLVAALRSGSFSVQWLNATRAGVDNFSFVPPLTPSSALPLVHHLGDVTLRVRPAAAAAHGSLGEGGESWAYFASAWGALRAEATPVPLRAGEAAAHDMTPLLDATDAPDAPTSGGAQAAKSPVTVRRAYRQGAKGLELTFEVRNVGAAALELGSFGMAMPAGVSQDVHIGGASGWVEWLRVHVNEQLELDESCIVATPLDNASALENWRPIFEYGGGGFEWAVHTAAWAEEWERNQQWPFLHMAAALNDTGLWPAPRSPWPSWGDAGQTVRVDVGAETHWNPPTSATLAPGAAVSYGVRLSACAGGPATRDAALAAAGVAVLSAVPGYTLATDMSNATLFVTPPEGVSVTGAVASDAATLRVGAPLPPLAASGAVVRISLVGLRRGRARVVVTMSDGSTAVAHYLVLPPLPSQVAALSHHWSEVAWLPRDYPDPFGRGASVLPWDREDGRHRLQDARAYDVGLSDDAGAASNLGLASAQAWAPTAAAVARLDEYVTNTLYGVKTDAGAHAPFKSLQLPEPNNGVRMTVFYYNQTYFPYEYEYTGECAVVAGLNYNWCMDERLANATYRGFNYPHQIAVWYSLYRAARNHPRIKTEHPWEWYLERAANTTLRLGFARIGYMDGTVTREVLNAVLEEAGGDGGPLRECGGGAGGGGGGGGAGGAIEPWATLGAKILAGEKSRADYFKTAPNPYGSEFAYDTTGQEEVVVWLLYFGYDDAAQRTIKHIQQYMRHLPNWAYNGGAVAGDTANGGKWFVSAGTGRGDFGKMHYRSGLNQIPLAEYFRRHPDELELLQIATGAVTGQLSNIDATGAPAILFHAYPHVMAHDAYSGDYGLGFFGLSLESSATLVLHAAHGPLCYQCDLAPPPPVAAAPAAVVEEDGGPHAATAGRSGTTYTLLPRDAYRQRVFLEPLGLYLQADAGVFSAVELDLAAQRITVTFAPPSETPAKTRTYDALRLRVDKVSLPEAKRPGDNFRVVQPATGVVRARAAWELPGGDGEVTAVIAYD